MDYESTNFYSKPSTPCFLTQIMGNQASSSETLSICHVIANVFLEIANFFRRLVCCGCEPLPLYTAKVIDPTPSSDDEGFRNEYLPKNQDSSLDESSSIEEHGIEEGSKERIPFISNETIEGLKSWKISFKEIDSYIKRIETEQDAIELIEACSQLPPSIYEDTLRKLALVADHTDSVLSAFHTKGLNNQDYFKQNHFTNLVSVFNTALYNELSLKDLSHLCKVDNGINQTMNGPDGYLNSPKHFDVRIAKLIELGDMVKDFATKLNEENRSKQSWRKEKLEDSKIVQHFYSLLNTLIIDLQNENELNTEKLKNDLLEYLLSKKRPVIRESCKELQKSVLQFFFDHSSVDQLSRFIEQECLFTSETIGKFYKCFFEELTDERQKKLLPLLEIENTTIVMDLISSFVRLCDNKQNLGSLAVKLACSFYETKPDSEVWEKVDKEKCGFWKILRCTLAEKKISLLMNQFTISPDLATEESLLKLADDFYAGFKTFPDLNNIYDYNLVSEYINNILLGIFGQYEQVRELTTEKLFIAFLRALSHDHMHISLFFERQCHSISESFGELWLSKFEALSVKVLFQSLLDIPIKSWEKPWDKRLLSRIHTEGQMNAFIDFCLELPEPLRTVQLCTLKSQNRYREEEEKDALAKILEERGIVLPEDSDKDWTDYDVYRNSFRMKTLFDGILALDSEAEVEIWIANHKECEALLQALAGGIVLLGDSIVQCPLNKDIIKTAFEVNELDYERFAKPMAVYDLLKTGNLKI